MEVTKHRSIFISDVHIGIRASKVKELLHFLKYNDCEHLYLLGDIIDGWRLKKNWFWNPDFNTFIQKVLRKARSGTKVYYIPGNHDEVFSDYCGFSFANIKVRKNRIHTTANNKRLLLMHGHEFDGIVLNSKWLAKIGAVLYDYSVWFNNILNYCRRKLGLSYWSLSGYLKTRVKDAQRFIENFENACLERIKKNNCDGIVCGHIHHPQIKKIGDKTYHNLGDWVDSCSAMVEDFDGNLELVFWDEKKIQSLEKQILNKVSAA
jgi:UDP-2,3-diacylglucosamine pyrophosphatase LpxH